MNPDKDPSQTQSRERNLLLVDDEENISRSLVRLLRQDNYKIFTADSGKQGLEILKQHEIGVIVSDQRMPEMSGTEFLHQVSQLYPDSIRMVLSGYTELKTITNAINEGNIYKFLTKPWDDHQLRKNVKEAFLQYEMADENKRLSRALVLANSELEIMNKILAVNIRNETRSAQINLRSLQVAQGILQNLPIGIIGVDEEKTIVLANDMANKILPGCGLIGDSAHDILPVDIDAIREGEVMTVNGNSGRDGVEEQINILLHKYKLPDEAEVVVMVMVPVRGVAYE